MFQLTTNAEEKQKSIEKSNDAVSLPRHHVVVNLHAGLVSVRAFTPDAAPTDLVAASSLEPAAACNLSLHPDHSSCFVAHDRPKKLPDVQQASPPTQRTDFVMFLFAMLKHPADQL